MSDHLSDQERRSGSDPTLLSLDSDGAVDATEREQLVAIAAVLPVLRAAERLSPDFDERVMSVARSEAESRFSARRPIAARGVSWWNRPLVFEIQPLPGLAIAAGLAGIVFAGALGMTGALRLGDWNAPTAVSAAVPSPDTVHVVRFVFLDPDAHSVTLAGDFNGWSANHTELESFGEGGLWTVSLPLPPGRHEYAFLVNGERWMADPLAPATIGEFDIESSVVAVGSANAAT
jgi:hypothetical protein